MRAASSATSGPGTPKERFSVSGLCRTASGPLAWTLIEFYSRRLATMPPNGVRNPVSARFTGDFTPAGSVYPPAPPPAG